MHYGTTRRRARRRDGLSCLTSSEWVSGLLHGPIYIAYSCSDATYAHLAYEPSKAHLLALDFFIVFLSMVLVTIAYEMSYAADMPPDTPDPLSPLSATPASPLPTDAHEPTKSTYVLELRLSTIIERLRNPPPPPPPRNTSSDDLLPMPNTTTGRLASGLQMLLRARQQQRQRARRAAATRPRDGGGGGREEDSDSDEDGEERQDVPGGLHTDHT